jgi:uncharacterized protein
MERAVLLAKRLSVAAILILGFSSYGSAEPFEDAVAAFNRGDHTNALQIIRPLAEKGNPSAQFSLGFAYAGGYGVSQNHVEAAKWYRLAAEQGDVKAQYSLGSLYYEGLGVPQSFAEAAKYFYEAAHSTRRGWIRR